jgi:hypothetical protein
MAGVIIAAGIWQLAAASSLTVSVDDHAVVWHGGFDACHTEILLSDIASAEPVTRTSGLVRGQGYTIRRYSLKDEARSYSLYGWNFVKITKRDGTAILVGSDETDKLAGEINSRVGQMSLPQGRSRS